MTAGLTQEQHCDLTRLMRDGMDADRRIEAGSSDPDDLTISATGKWSRERLIEENVQLVRYAVQKSVTLSMESEFEDAVQDGVLGLIEAIEGYDPDSGNSFASYAFRIIVKAAHDGQRRSSVVYPARDAARRLNDIRKAQERLVNHGQSPTESAVAEQTGMKSDRVRDALVKSISFDFSNSTVMAETNVIPMFVAEPEQPGRVAEFEDLKRLLNLILDSLTPRERYLIQHFFGLDALEETTPEVIRLCLGLSPRGFTLMKRRALSKLRHPATTRALDEFLVAAS